MSDEEHESTTMSGWTADELDRVGEATELQINSIRADGTLRPYTTVWGARVGDELYVRSAHGSGNGWFRRAAAAGTGRVRAAGVERDVVFRRPDDAPHAAIDAEYHRKYDRYGRSIVGRVVGSAAAEATLSLDGEPGV